MQIIIYRMINKVLLYSIGNYIQYPVINHYGKECVCVCVCVCVYRIFSAHYFVDGLLGYFRVSAVVAVLQ